MPSILLLLPTADDAADSDLKDGSCASCVAVGAPPMVGIAYKQLFAMSDVVFVHHQS